MSWHVACFCGATWEAEEANAACPRCGELVTPFVPVSPTDEDCMRVELQTLLDEHGLTGE